MLKKMRSVTGNRSARKRKRHRGRKIKVGKVSGVSTTKGRGKRERKYLVRGSCPSLKRWFDRRKG